MLYQGDNTQAFGGSFLKINLVSEEPIPEITKAEIRIGCLFKVISNPSFPLVINLNEEETSKLNTTNTAYMAVWDSLGRKKTCKGSITIQTQPRRV